MIRSTTPFNWFVPARVPLLMPALASLLASTLASAQTVTVRDAGRNESAPLVRAVLAAPHAIVVGSGRVDFPRDSTITTSLVVLGRDTYLASRVQGDVVVIGANLFLRQGVDVSGRVTAIGGTVTLTTLGRVGGEVQSLRDESYAIEPTAGGFALAARETRVATDPEPVFQLAGLQGLLTPSYDRVDGLSLPIGAVMQLGDHAFEVEPTATYRSRLGTVDPAVTLRLRRGGAPLFEGRAARTTRSNDAWNYSDLVNSALVLFLGTDTRNYFRSNLGEGRVFAHVEGSAFTFDPYIGGRFERVSGITASGNVYSFRGRTDPEKTSRFNPVVVQSDIGSALVGERFDYTGTPVTGRLYAELEQGLTTNAHAGRFTQLTLDGRLDFPTFGTQRLAFRGHGVATAGDSVSLARYAYLGGSGTLPVLDILEQGGTELLFVESRYIIPVAGIVLPLAGSPVLTLRHIMGAAGVGSLPRLEQEIGAGVGLSALRFDVTTDVARHRGTKVGLGISLTK